MRSTHSAACTALLERALGSTEELPCRSNSRTLLVLSSDRRGPRHEATPGVERNATASCPS